MCCELNGVIGYKALVWVSLNVELNTINHYQLMVI